MTQDFPPTGLQLRSLVRSRGELELTLLEVPTAAPGADEVVVRVEAAPINPSDIGLLLGPADLATAAAAGSADRPVLTARIPERARASLQNRLDQSMPVGNEGAGVVIAAGTSAAAQALRGRTVAVLGGAMYSQYRTVRVEQCLALPPGTTSAEGASSFVNPLTALGMVETMRREGHHALVHTAAASNLGRMLERICRADGVALVNIVRSAGQAAALREGGGRHVCDSSAPSFVDDLTAALAETGATLAFDAIGGGRLAGQILNAMEAALGRGAKEYSRYGSATHKQVYVYGGLDPAPTELVRGAGMAWGLGGWLLFPFLHRIGPHAAQALKARVAAELKTTFASRYARVVSLAEALQPDVVAVYGRRATGEKFLIDPSRRP